VRVLDPETGLVLGTETLGRKAGPLDHRRGKGREFLRRRRIVEGLQEQCKALVHSLQGGALVAEVVGVLLPLRLNVVAVVPVVGFVVLVVPVVVQLQLQPPGCVDGFRPRSLTRRGQNLSRSMKRRNLCGQRKGNLCGRCEGGLEPSCSSPDGPTPAPAVLAVIRSARIYVAAVEAPVAPRRRRSRPRHDDGRDDGDGDDDGATGTP
jgi:hypothetical protein